MITVVVDQKGKSIPLEIKDVIGKMAEEHTKILADEHKKELDKAIEDTRVRPKGLDRENSISENIKVEKIDTGYGVGNINTLNQNAKHWAWINFGIAGTGRRVPPQTTGYFEPGQMNPDSSSFREGRLVHTKEQNVYQIIPKKAIQAHNYIEKALGIMLGKIRSLLK